eukprot:scaffold875_cov185-Amphora_coffeaeformis.AAC.5
MHRFWGASSHDALCAADCTLTDSDRQVLLINSKLREGVSSGGKLLGGSLGLPGMVVNLPAMLPVTRGCRRGQEMIRQDPR